MWTDKHESECVIHSTSTQDISLRLWGTTQVLEHSKCRRKLLCSEIFYTVGTEGYFSIVRTLETQFKNEKPASFVLNLPQCFMKCCKYHRCRYKYKVWHLCSSYRPFYLSLTRQALRATCNRFRFPSLVVVVRCFPFPVEFNLCDWRQSMWLIDSRRSSQIRPAFC